MSTPVLATKLYIPPPRPGNVLRPRLVERLNEGLSSSRKLTLISAPAGFGKTTLLSEWVAVCETPTAWLSLDEGDSDPKRFLTYLVAALQMIAPNTGAGLLSALQAPQPPPVEAILTNLLNEIAAIPGRFILVLDDYHTIDAPSIDSALTFLLEHLPPPMHIVIATREDPHLPLARLRVRGQLTELRAADLRFTPLEAADFLNQVMGLGLSAENITALEMRTEGWIAGLQMAAISLRGLDDATAFIESFTGSHHFVLDYLVEEVLQKQPLSVQSFLLRTSILERLCAPLCDVVTGSPSGVAQDTLAYLERANLFIVPLDGERRWCRYHHLFAELLRQRLHHSVASGVEEASVAEYHIRASRWYEDHGLEMEAFHHAAAANDVGRAARLLQGKGIPLHVRGGLFPVLNWLQSLPATLLDANPILWVMYAGALTTAGQTTGVEAKLRAAEVALQGAELDVATRDILGRIANNRAILAITQYQADDALFQARRALEYLRPDNLPVRSISTWALGAAQQQKGDRSAAICAFTEAIATSETIDYTFVTQLATVGLGRVQEIENRLHLAAETYRQALVLFGTAPLPFACEAHLGLARVYYEWNDLNAAEHHGQESLRLARQFDRIIDRFIICELFLARLQLARGDVAGAAALLAQADQAVHQRNFERRLPEVAAAQALTLLHQGDTAAAARLVQTHDLPMIQARVHLAQGDAAAALTLLRPLRQHMEARGWVDELLKVIVLQAVALHGNGDRDMATQRLGEALALARPGGFIRIFVDEGPPMAQLLTKVAARGMTSDYVTTLLAAFSTENRSNEDRSSPLPHQPLIEPLSQRELEILRLVARGLSNREIGERVFLALSTVKGHNQQIFDKLQVHRRTEAVARARELGLL